MPTFQAPPSFRDISTERPDGTREIDQAWNDWFIQLSALLSKGISRSVPLAKLTGPGTDGSLTIVNGVITAVILPT